MFESSPKAFWVCRKLKVEMFWLRKLGESFLLRRLRRTGWPVALSLNHQSWNLTIIRAFLCDILPINQYLQQTFWPNIVPSFGTGPPHIYKGFTKGKIQKIHYGP